MPRIDPRATEWRFVEGEIVGLDLKTEEYFSIKGSGVALWRRMAEGATEEELASMLRERYGVSAETARTDLDAFLGRLRERGLVQS
ncbi:MAG: PqqD family protein [Actinobacteria bacterium]|nr:PqqD family protein [Actinomycetota bacterium]MCA1720270.1 PqqD family protein [Actinomycetota bacterium]